MEQPNQFRRENYLRVQSLDSMTGKPVGLCVLQGWVRDWRPSDAAVHPGVDAAAGPLVISSGPQEGRGEGKVYRVGWPAASIPGTAAARKRRRADSATMKSTSTDDAPAFKAIAQRLVNAENRFHEFTATKGFSREESERILAVYKRARVIKLDAVNGTFHVKHGAFLDSEPLQNALKS